MIGVRRLPDASIAAWMVGKTAVADQQEVVGRRRSRDLLDVGERIGAFRTGVDRPSGLGAGQGHNWRRSSGAAS